ncbi:hypothetical protein L1049_027289 [Liquidambar formosana]|uniref:Uncharacterized protein n=1 Tax=Liquidambar formosana TaxID=63359 RepID=A0AAP0N469_LIQFO
MGNGSKLNMKETRQSIGGGAALLGSTSIHPFNGKVRSITMIFTLRGGINIGVGTIATGK